jgi:hypothetical protein
VTRFKGGEVAENPPYPLGDVRNKGLRRGCRKVSGNGVDESRKWARYEISKAGKG